jgi:hypothetical protein
MSGRGFLAATLCLLGCGHSESFLTPISSVGPSSDGPDVLLTLNSNQNYWPSWTEDGIGIIYAFVDASQSSATNDEHRCMGLLPAEGGTRLWQWCDNRAVMKDSLSSFPAFALGADGRLLYVESTGVSSLSLVPSETTLWLADTAFPFRRRLVSRLPVTIGDSTVSWFADLEWTGPTTFMGLGQRYVPAACICPGGLDSVFYGETVVRGTINPEATSLLPVSGTSGATSYALADNGSTIVFTERNSPNLFRVPVAGGAPVLAAVVTSEPGVQLLGVSCRDFLCVVAVGPVTLWAATLPGPAADPSTDLGTSELRLVSLTTGESVPLLSRTSGLLSSPLVSKKSGDVVVQLGQMMGHLQTFAAPSNLHLYKALLP